MKKLLALVLAMAMTLGLATVGASAAEYSDAADIDYKEAVDVMSAIEVFDGMDGAFNPEGTLTREQGAKIIAYMILGKKAADSLTTAKTSFTDVAADRWSAGAIEYAVSEGIIGGRGDGTFDPAGELTGYAFAKMCLVALGYKADVEVYTGSDWAINVATDAFEAGLNSDLNLVMSQGISRQEACQMALNTLKGTMVKYTGGTNITTSDGTTVVSGAVRSEVSFDDWDYANRGTNDTLQFVEKYYSSPRLTLNDDSTDDFDRPANTWTLGNKAIGDFASTPAVTYTAAVKGKTIYADLGKPKITANTTVVNKSVNGVVTYGATDMATVISADYSGDLDGSGRGIKTEVFYNRSTGKIDIVQTKTFLAKALTDYNTSTGKLTVSIDDTTGVSINSISGDDFAVVTGAKKDDLYYVTAARPAGSWVLGTVEAVPSGAQLAGLTASTRSSSAVTLDGTKYSTAAQLANSAGDCTSGNDFALQNTKYDVVLDPYGYILYAEAVSATTANVEDYLFVNNAKMGVSTVDASVIRMDGTTAEIKVSKVDTDGAGMVKVTDTTTWSTATAASKVAIGAFYTYALQEDNSYALTYVNTTYVDALSIVPNKATQTNITGILNSKTALVAGTDNDNLSAYLGVANFPTVTNSETTPAYVVTVAATAAVPAILAYGTVSSGTTSNYVYLYNGGTQNKESSTGTAYYTYDAFMDGANTTMAVKAGEAEVVGGGLFKIAYDSKGRLAVNSGATYMAGDGAAAYSVTNIGTIAVSNGNITLSDTYAAGSTAMRVAYTGTYGTAAQAIPAGMSTTYTLNKDAEFFYIDLDDKASSGPISGAEAQAKTVANKNATANYSAGTDSWTFTGLTEFAVYLIPTSGSDPSIKQIWVVENRFSSGVAKDWASWTP